MVNPLALGTPSQRSRGIRAVFDWFDVSAPSQPRLELGQRSDGAQVLDLTPEQIVSYGQAVRLFAPSTGAPIL
jgi:hypothetical protein